MVGRHDVPRCPLGAGMTQHAVEGALVVLPVAPLPDVAGRELPVLCRVVDALDEPFGLLSLRHVEHDLDDMDAVVDQVALPGIDLPVAAVPDVAFRCRRGQSMCPRYEGKPNHLMSQKG